MEHRRQSSVTDSTMSQQSLLTALNRFVSAVNTMDSVVMIPSRLRDLETGSDMIVEDNNNNNKDASQMMNGLNGDRTVAIPSDHNGMDLYKCFSMLHAIRDEIIEGSRAEDDETAQSTDEGDNDETTTSRKTANMFRYHLRGLFSLLHQLTNTAQYLGSRYERDVTQNQTTFKL